jgi:hypothetical protein
MLCWGELDIFLEGMTMRNLVWAALATGFLLVGFNVVSANDTVRLGGPSVASGIGGGTDTELVRGRAYYGGHYGHAYYGRGYYGGAYYRPYYGAYYRPYYYGGYYRPYYASYYYQPYYSSYYYTPYYTSSYYYYPIAGEAIAPPATTLQGASYYQAPAPRQYVPPMPPPDGGNGNGTYPYDGGPRSPIPMPNPDMNPAKAPQGILPADGKLVSLPNEATGGVSVPLTHQPTSTTSTSVPRVTYPAYGDEPIAPAPRKTSR